MAAIGEFRSGKNSRVIFEGVTLNKSKWDLELKGDDIDTTNFESEGIDQGVIGIVSVDWNIGGLWDSEADSLADPPGLYPRDDADSLLLYVNLADDLNWTLDNNRVLSSKNGAEIKQAVTFDTSGKLQGGPFYMPGDIEFVEEDN